MRRQVTVDRAFGDYMIASFQENNDGVVLERDTCNYEPNEDDFMKFAADCYEWVFRGSLP